MLKTRLRTEGYGVRIKVVAGDLLFFKRATPALGLTQLPIQWVMQSFPCDKTTGCESDHFILYSLDAKNECSYICSAPVHLHGVRCTLYTVKQAVCVVQT